VFGHVVRGTNVLERFNNLTLVNGVYTNGIYRYQRESPFSELPVLQISTNPAVYHLFITEIALLVVEAHLNPDGSREISWSSVRGLTNHVEFTTNMPPPGRTSSAPTAPAARSSSLTPRPPNPGGSIVSAWTTNAATL